MQQRRGRREKKNPDPKTVSSTTREEYDILFETLPLERQHVHMRVLLTWFASIFAEAAGDGAG